MVHTVNHKESVDMILVFSKVSSSGSGMKIKFLAVWSDTVWFSRQHVKSPLTSFKCFLLNTCWSASLSCVGTPSTCTIKTCDFKNINSDKLLNDLVQQPWGLTCNRPFPSSPVPLFQNKFKCDTFHMKMSSACSFIFMQIKVIFLTTVSHVDSL